MRRAGAIMWLGLLAAAPVLAQGLGDAPPDSPQCQQQCGAVLPRRIDNPRDVQVCLGRCQALERLRPPPAATAAPSRRPTVPAPARMPAPPTANPPTANPPAPPAGEGPFGAVYLAPAPSANAGLAANMTDREAAHRAAEQQCIGRQGVTCRLALEFRDRCAAVAQGLAPKGMMLTTDPSTFQVVVATAGSGATQAMAESEATTACRQRFRGTCRVVRSICG